MKALTTKKAIEIIKNYMKKKTKLFNIETISIYPDPKIPGIWGIRAASKKKHYDFLYNSNFDRLHKVDFMQWPPF